MSRKFVLDPKVCVQQEVRLSARLGRVGGGGGGRGGGVLMMIMIVVVVVMITIAFQGAIREF